MRLLKKQASFMNTHEQQVAALERLAISAERMAAAFEHLVEHLTEKPIKSLEKDYGTRYSRNH